MHLYSHTVEDMTKFANQIKEITIAGLEVEGFLKGDVVETLCSEYVIVLAEPGTFGKIWKKLRCGKKEDKNILTISFMKDVRLDGKKGEPTDEG